MLRSHSELDDKCDLVIYVYDTIIIFFVHYVSACGHMMSINILS